MSYKFGEILKMNFEEIKELIKIFSDSSISKMAIKNGETEFSLEKGGVVSEVVTVAPQVTVQETVQTETKPVEAKVGLTLNSPMVGTFYAAPAPNAPNFVKVGDKAVKGQTIGILEAMKIMNEWEAEFDCKIIRTLVEDGQPVEYGTPIFEVEKI
jgi:acetyl-CoA carboxylase biotin carboxyl carrier protein